MPSPPPLVPEPGKARDIALLRHRLRGLERGGRTGEAGVLPLGLDVLDQALPGGGLDLGALHEIVEASEGDGAATGFALHLIARRLRQKGMEGRPALWCAPEVDLYAPGLAGFGLDPARLVIVRARRRTEILWVLEEALRCRGLAAVLGEVPGADLASSRRLQLAAAGGGFGLLLHRREATSVRATGPSPTSPSAATTRWQVASVPGGAGPAGVKPMGGLPGPPRWRLDLLRCRGGRPAAWLVDGHFREDGNGATGGFALAAAIRDGTARPGTASPDPIRRDPIRAGR